ncbi:methyl-accepting chemotaxis protein [Clostridium cellulovorans]|uniref:Methyl-accepting chemotaxis sensory transducer with Cache sensor n=1 Tax=Clostridium cellulovorans (strain ATCC 35296 / DSM 3052 / OCM 3 / 743B) TaxID=573061 RepID=D9SRW9_CLOC7|nr:methyl-accepting chemotaxis protein [Clostridium cellulovorans]ADL50486.1 methyl-accepting chemotaxis sensory transducer with Cache sensor [Clostridium cellulovorans 743B]
MEKQKKRNINFRSIKIKMIAVLTTLCIVPIGILGFITYNKSNKIVSTKFTESNQQTVLEVNRGLDSYFQGIESMLRMLSNNVNLKEMAIKPLYEEFAVSLLQDSRNARTDIMNFYFGQPSKKMTLYPAQELPKDYDPTTRTWYKNAIENPGKVVYSNPYQDAVSGKMIVSLSMAVKNNDAIVGVLAADINLDTLSQSISSIKIGRTGFAVISTYEGVVIAHPDSSLLAGTEITKLSNWEEIKNSNSGINTYQYKGVKKYCSYITNETTGWKLMSAVPEEELLSDTNVIKNINMILILVLGLIALVGSIFFSRSITKKMNILKAAFNKAAEGDLSVNASIDSKDEFEDLSKDFNRMIANIGSLIHNLKYSTDVIATNSNSISKMASETTAEVNKISATIEQVANGSIDQVQNIDEGVHSIEELATNISNIDSLTNKMNEISKETNTLSENGVEAVNILSKKTDEANNHSNEVMVVIKDMNGATEQIGNITSTINSIAEQTNLLALNAAIESARAGEAGKGFAVVAEEIRKLADQSSEATKQIQELIMKVKEKSVLAVSTMEGTKVVIDEQTKAVTLTKDIFDKISDSIKILKGETDEIAVALTETNKKKEDIIEKIQNISAVSEEASASTEEVSAATEEVVVTLEEFGNSASQLNELVKVLETEVNKFKL